MKMVIHRRTSETPKPLAPLALETRKGTIRVAVPRKNSDESESEPQRHKPDFFLKLALPGLACLAGPVLHTAIGLAVREAEAIEVASWVTPPMLALTGGYALSRSRYRHLAPYFVGSVLYPVMTLLAVKLGKSDAYLPHRSYGSRAMPAERLAILESIIDPYGFGLSG
jgi:hypothetical protein